MLKYILMILGGVIFIAGYYFMQQNEGRGKTMMFYSLFTYAGLRSEERRVGKEFK